MSELPTSPTTPVSPAGAAARSGPSALAATMVMVRLFVGEMLTRGRMVALGGLGVLWLVGAFASGFADDAEARAEVAAELGITVIVPIVTLVLASSTLGGLRSDGTLVYVWLRPVPRWTIAVAAAAASIGVALPATVLVAALGGLVAGDAAVAGGAVAASAVAVVGYTGVFVPLGAAMRRSFIVGLVYVLVWGGLLAQLGSGFAAVSVESYGVAAIERAAEVNISGGNHSVAAIVVAPVVFLVAGLAVATWVLRRREIE